MFPKFIFLGEIVYLYPLLLGIAWGVGFISFLSLFSGKIKQLNLLFFSLFISSWCGAKIFFLLSSDLINTDNFLKSTSFWLGGGFVFYGGFIFGLLSLWLFSTVTKQTMSTFSPIVIPLGIGHGIGRVGCFLAGCCHGKVVSISSFVEYFPIQLVEAFSLFVLSFICFRRLKKNKEIFIFYISSYAVLRFILEAFRGDDIRGLYYGVSTSQIISASLIAFSIGLYRKQQPVH